MLYLLYLALMLSLVSTTKVDAAEQRAILQLNLNETEKGDVLVLLRAEDIWVRVEDLHKAGLRSFSGRRDSLQGEMYVSLGSLAPLVSFELDERALVLRVMAQPSLLDSTVLELQPGRPADISYAENPSAFLNYAFNLRDFSRYDAFGEMGVSLRRTLLYGSISKSPDDAVVRGLTNWTLDNRESLTRWKLGDNFANSGVLGGSLFLGGVSFQRDFNLDPYFVRNPSLTLSGAAFTPSTVDVYVNGQLLRRERLPAGPFELKNLPVPAGSGATRLVLRDAFGREQEVTSPFYFTTGLLKEGLHEFSYNLGYRRKNIGIESWDYSSPAFLGRHRLGFTNDLTAGFRLEGSSSLVSVGSSLTTRLPIGEVEFSIAASQAKRAPGGALSLGYSYLGRPFNFGASLRALSPHYANLSLGAEDERSWLEISMVTGFQLTSRTNLSMQYAFANSQSKGQSQRVSLISSTRLTDRISLFLSGSHSREEGKKVNELFSGLTVFFGSTTGTLSYQQRDDVGTGRVEIQKPLPIGSGFGYRFQANTTRDRNQIAATLQYQGPYGRYEAAYDRVNGQDSSLFSVSGGLVAIGGGIYPSRSVQESFALIRVPKVANVRGYLSNQEVGYSDSQGDLLVPNLIPYYGNRLSIAAEDIPFDHSVDATEKMIAPPPRGGAIITFPVRRIQRMTGSLIIEVSGREILPAYGQLTVTASGKQFESPIGKEGELYIENLPVGRHPAEIEYKENKCQFFLEVPEVQQTLINLGENRCKAASK